MAPESPPTLRRARLDEIFDLRHAVLLPAHPPAAARFEGDDEAGTRHYGAFEGPEAVACASVMRRPWNGEPAWQLRGMATRPDRQRQGLGGRLLAFVEEDVSAEAAVTADRRAVPPRPRLWCNARAGAAAFYRRHGWEIASDAFPIEGVGPHYRMTKVLSATTWPPPRTHLITE